MEQKIDLKQIEGVLDELAKVKGSLITILQKTQDIYGYLPKDAIIYISERTGIAESEIMGVATFYTQFRLAPVGKYLIMLCQGTACHVNSSELILQTIKDELGIEDGETTEDGLFSLKWGLLKVQFSNTLAQKKIYYFLLLCNLYLNTLFLRCY